MPRSKRSTVRITPTSSCSSISTTVAITEPDLVATIRRAGPRIGHVQFARHTGPTRTRHRHDRFRAGLGGAEGTGYVGAVSAEYRPKGETLAGLGWMKDFREMME